MAAWTDQLGAVQPERRCLGTTVQARRRWTVSRVRADRPERSASTKCTRLHTQRTSRCSNGSDSTHRHHRTGLSYSPAGLSRYSRGSMRPRESTSLNGISIGSAVFAALHGVHNTYTDHAASRHLQQQSAFQAAHAMRAKKRQTLCTKRQRSRPETSGNPWLNASH